MPNDDYISVEEAADLIGRSPRHTSRYANKVRTIRVGTRTLYHRDDMAHIAAELRARDSIHERAEQHRPQPKQPSTELVPPGEMLDYVRERDHQVERITQQLTVAAHRVGELEALLSQRLLPEDAAALRQERDALQEEIRRLKGRPWWKRLLNLP